jgi:methylamine utilization protein MauJ
MVMKKKGKKRIRNKPAIKPTVPRPSEPAVEIDRPDSTTWMKFAFVPGFSHLDLRSLIPRHPDGALSIYQVTMVLCIPGKATYHDNIALAHLSQSGESLLEIGRFEYDMTLTSGEVNGLATFAGNSQGLLSTARIRVQAQSFQDARKLAYDMVAPCLSWWCYRYDVPLDIKGYEVLEEFTGTREYIVGMLGKTKDFDREDLATFGQEFRSILAIYREAVNSTNLFYKVLSFYKVAEGLRSLLGERRQKALKNKEAWTDPIELIPEKLEDIQTDSWDKEEFKPFLGKKFNWVLDQYRGLIRNAVAHLDPASHVLDADKFEDIGVCEDAVPVLKYMARKMLDRELQARKLESQAHDGNTGTE